MSEPPPKTRKLTTENMELTVANLLLTISTFVRNISEPNCVESNRTNVFKLTKPVERPERNDFPVLKTQLSEDIQKEINKNALHAVASVIESNDKDPGLKFKWWKFTVDLYVNKTKHHFILKENTSLFPLLVEVLNEDERKYLSKFHMEFQPAPNDETKCHLILSYRKAST